MALADEVMLRDGSRIVGTNVRIIDGHLLMNTAFATDLSIPMDQVTSISTDAPVAIDLPSGERFIGSLAADKKGITVNTPAGATPVAVRDIAGMWDPKGPSPEDLAIEAKKPKWSGRFEFGIDGRTGNSERTTVQGGASLLRTTPSNRTNFYVRGRLEEQNGKRSANELFVGTSHEFDLNDRLFVFGKLDLETDEFEDLDLRATTQVGLGYFFIQDDRRELKGRVGAGYRHEDFGAGGTTNEAILSLGYDSWWSVSDRSRLTHGGVYTPAFGDFSDYTLTLDTGLEIALSDDKAWKLRLGMRNEYDSEPVPGVEELDTTYFANIAFDW